MKIEIKPINEDVDILSYSFKNITMKKETDLDSKMEVSEFQNENDFNTFINQRISNYMFPQELIDTQKYICNYSNQKEYILKFERLDNLFKQKYQNNEIVLPHFGSILQSTEYNLDEMGFSEGLDAMISVFNYNTTDNSICKFSFDKLDDYFLYIDLKSYQTRLSDKLFNKLEKCFKNNNTRIIILPLHLSFVNMQEDYQSKPNNTLNKSRVFGAHSNLLIIDKQLQKLIFYEPHGTEIGHFVSKLVKIDELILGLLIDYKFIPNDKYEFINASSSCIIGLQTIQGERNPDVGHCAVWSLYFILIRLLNMHLNVPENTSLSEFINSIVTTFYKMNNQNPDRMIKQFFKYIRFLQKNIRLLYGYNTFDSNTLDILYKTNNYMSETTRLTGLRLTKLIREYFLNYKNYKGDFIKIFEEIVSYKNHPDFYEILIREFDNSIARGDKYALEDHSKKFLKPRHKKVSKKSIIKK